MNLEEDGLKAEDHAYRRAAESYFEEKGRLAREAFDSKQLETFLSFEEHWKEFFAPAGDELLREYLATPFEIRKNQFERFKRECRAWEVSFQHGSRRPVGERPAGSGAGPGPGNGYGSGNGNGNGSGNGNGTGSSTSSGTDWSDLKRRIEAQRDKVEQVRAFYSNLDNLLDRVRQRQRHPLELLPHFRLLGVPSDASLEDVKAQYRRLAKVHHPDRHGDPVKMGRIADAYKAILAYYKVA